MVASMVGMKAASMAALMVGVKAAEKAWWTAGEKGCVWVDAKAAV